MARPRKVALDTGAEVADVPAPADDMPLAERIAAAQDGADHATQCALRALAAALNDLQMRAAAADVPADIAERIANL